MARRRVVAVACSGGRDSIALLHAAVHAATADDVHVVALHVHHGLVPEADTWWTHVESLCRDWHAAGLPVSFAGTRLHGAPSPGDSVEAWARAARYDALTHLARDAGATLVLLAHHRRDQSETFLLQALRGAGPAGLAAMPSTFTRSDAPGLVWERPWLGRTRASIDAYCAAHGLAHVDDPSNDDPRFARNRLRHMVWPALCAAFPDAEATFAAAAAKAAHADEALREIAAIDADACADAQGLRIADWLLHSPARRRFALKAWVERAMAGPCPAALLDRLVLELDGAGPATWPAPGGTLRRFRRVLSYAADARTEEPAHKETCLSIREEGAHVLPGWGGRLQATAVNDGGVPLAWLAHLELRERQGGESFQAGFGRPARSLKKQYQAAGVPEWDRDGPLVYSGGQLVFVPGLGIDARVVGLPGQAQVVLTWQRGDVTER